MAVVASASPWARGDGRVFIASNAEYFSAEGDFLASTPNDFTDKYQRYEARTYGEFGLTDSITLGGTIVYGVSEISNELEIRNASGFSQLEGFIQHQLWKGIQDVGAIRLIGAAPTRFETGVRPGIETDGAAIEARFLYGRNLIAGSSKLFSTVEVGYRKRLGNAADFGQLDFTFGYEPSPKWLLLLQSFNTISVRNSETEGTDFDIFKVSPSVAWRIGDRWSIQAGMTYEYAGRNIPTGNTYFLSLWSSF